MADEHSKVTPITAARRMQARAQRVLAHPKSGFDVRALVWFAQTLEDSQDCIALEGPHEAPGAHGWALTPQQARLVAAMLIAGADKFEGKGG